jgi:hypothetical protein
VLDIVCAHITRGAADQGGDEESGEVDDSQAWPVLYFSTVVLAKALAGTDTENLAYACRFFGSIASVKSYAN